MPVSESTRISILRRGIALLSLLVASPATWAGTSVQPGFYHHEPPDYTHELREGGGTVLIGSIPSNEY